MDPYLSTPTPSSPTTNPLATKELKQSSTLNVTPVIPDSNPSHHSTLDTRSMNLEVLREQLVRAKIPFTKRSSLNEVPQSAEDCHFVPGTTRCSIILCQDDCMVRHVHHHTHARPIKPDGTLIYSRPSISMLPTSTVVSNFQSPAESPCTSIAPSQTNSPQPQYRRSSGFGFNFGTRGSLTSGSGWFTPADMASGPPSPMSGIVSAESSAPTSPRQTLTTSDVTPSVLPSFAPDFTKPIAEEREQVTIAPSQSEMMHAPTTTAAATSSSSSSTAAVGSAPPPVGSFWKLRDRIINLHDYALSVVGKGTPESLTRQDLAPAPREDCPVQEDPSWDPRSPQPPSPVDFETAEVVRVNMNQEDKRNPEIQYELKPNFATHM